jgi:hypothetical protein
MFFIFDTIISKSLTKYNAFKDDFNERDFGHRNIKFTQLHIN